MTKLVDVYDASGIRAGALEFLYALMREREPEINISHRELPSFEQHRQFVTRRPFRYWYLIEIYSEWVGYISATDRNEIGIVILKAYRGQGHGPAAIRLLLLMHAPLPADPSVRNGHWLANIAPANEHSKHAFEKLGFRKIQETYEFNEEETHGNTQAA